MLASDRASLIIQLYILGIPLWWFLGIDFLAPQCVAVLLICMNPRAHCEFTLSDYVLLAIILTFALSAYVVGFLIFNKTMRLWLRCITSAYGLLD